MVDVKENVQFEFKGKGGTFIRISTLDKAKKGHYKNDIVRLKCKSVSTDLDVYITPKEALVISTGLNMAVLFCKKQNKRLLD